MDLIYPLNPSWLNSEIDQRGLMFSSPIVKIMGGTMVKPSNANLDMAKFNTLAVPRGFTPIEWFKLQGRYDFNIVEVSTAWDALNMVLLGGADGADIEFNVANALMKEKLSANPNMLAGPPLVLGEQLPVSQIHFFLVTYKHHFLIKKLDQFVLEHKSEIAKLKGEYRLVEKVINQMN